MNGISKSLDIDLLLDICKDYFQNRGYDVETNAALSNELKWRPSVIAKRNQELIALEIRTTEDLPDFLMRIFNEAKIKVPNVKIYLGIPVEAKISGSIISKTAKLGIGIYRIEGTSLKIVFSPDQEAVSSIEQESVRKKQEFVISPNTPYGNIMALRTVLRGCQNFIFWLEKNFARNGIERLYEELVEDNLNNVQEIRILCGPEKVTPRFRDDFRRFKKECEGRRIKVKCKVICDKETLKNLHDRYLLTQGCTYSLMPLSSLEMGQWGSLFESEAQFPFDLYWKKGKDIDRKWKEIYIIGEEMRKKKHT